MTRKTVPVDCGKLDARSIAKLVSEAGEYRSEIIIEIGEKTINAKSVMGMMSLGLCEEKELCVVANGDDENEAADGIASFFARL